VITVRSIKFHTYDGIERPPNARYTIVDTPLIGAADLAETVLALGLAVREDPPKPPAKPKK